MKEFSRSLQEGVLLYDGSKGVVLQAQGLKGAEAAESWNLLKPEVVKSVYRQYREAGSDVIQTNTFPGNRITLQGHGLAEKVYELNYAGVKLAKEIAGEDLFVAASVGPTGLFFAPVGELTFNQAYNIFQEQVKAFADAGADLINFETFTDLSELRAAILAAKENTNLPIIASCTFTGKGSTLSGNPPEVCALVCQALGPVVVGANCSGGPDSLLAPIQKMSAVADVPLVVKPNAGLPAMVQGQTIYQQTPEEFAAYTKVFVENGVRLIGGCCGTTPEFIRALKNELVKMQVPPLKPNNRPLIASAYSYFDFSQSPDPAVQKLAVEDFIAKPGGLNNLIEIAQGYETVDYLLLDFGAYGELDLWEFVSSFSFSVKVPVVIKSQQPQVLTEFLRYYPGRAGVMFTGAAGAVSEKLEHYGAYILKEK